GVMMMMMAVVVRWWCDGGGGRGVEWGGSRRGWRRVAASGYGDRVDPLMRITFGVRRKNPPEKSFRQW
ncbi:hypothetical protein Tco_0476570, partial [Tanacetum coccineum]